MLRTYIVWAVGYEVGAERRRGEVCMLRRGAGTLGVFAFDGVLCFAFATCMYAWYVC